MAATAKHFPGLGAATRSQNTDLVPVTLRHSLSTLRAVDEAPYVSAIAAGVKLVMTSWAVYPALDPHLPAGSVADGDPGGAPRPSGFAGVTITDGIEAGALAPFGGVGRRAVLAASAGADLILCAATNPDDNTPAIGTTARNAIADCARPRHAQPDRRASRPAGRSSRCAPTPEGDAAAALRGRSRVRSLWIRELWCRRRLLGGADAKEGP